MTASPLHPHRPARSTTLGSGFAALGMPALGIARLGMAAMTIAAAMLSIGLSARAQAPTAPATPATTIAAGAPAMTGYHIVRTIPVPGSDGWDYMNEDSASGHLFISRGTHVQVLDIATGKLVGDIPDTQGVHGIALAPEFGRGFTSDGRADMVTIFDLKTLATLGTAKTDTGPDCILYDPATKRVFTMNGRAGTATAIDAATGAVAGSVALGGRPEFGVSDGAGHVYVNLEDKSELVQLDAQKLTVLNTWPLAPCDSPSGLAIDRAHRRLFSGCHNQMMAIVDADSGKVVATAPIGSGVDANRFDPGTQLAFSSNGDGTLTVVKELTPDAYQVLGNVPTQRGARTMEVDLATHHVFLITATYGPAPAATADNPRPRPSIVPDSFVVIELAP
jgi:DNA-binding beta-propeller fold protein YncE